MTINTYKQPHSSFLSVDKDMSLIVDKIMSNERLKKLLYYTTKDCLEKPKLTPEETREMFGKNIKIIPKLQIDSNVLNYLFIQFDNFTPNGDNPEFRDNLIELHIVCHYDQWHLKDFEMRPFKIAAELDTMLNDAKMTGIGKLQFFGAKALHISDEFGGICLMYQAIHGEDDKKGALNPADDAKLKENFEQWT